MKDKMGIKGHVIAELFGPDGRLKGRWEMHNLVTDVGDNNFAKFAYLGSPTNPAGMKLGTATTAASKNGAGSFVAVGDYVSGSAQAFDSTWPKVGASNNIAQYKVTYAAGTATNSNINRVSITDNTTNAGEADASHTYSAAVFSGAINKGALDTLTVTWNITFLGA